MGLIDLLTPKKQTVTPTTSALQAAREGRVYDGAISGLIGRLLGYGLDGVGPLDPADVVASTALAKTGDAERAVDAVIRRTTVGGGIGGLATGMGGFVTMPIALPVNVLEFYVQATRMVGAVAALRGYDLRDETIRTAVLLTLIGSHADEVLSKAGIATGGGRVAEIAAKRLGPSGGLMIRKAIGFRLLRGVGERAFSRLGRGVPLVGGLVGAGLDGWMMHRIGEAAKQEFPPLAPLRPAA